MGLPCYKPLNKQLIVPVVSWFFDERINRGYRILFLSFSVRLPSLIFIIREIYERED